MSIKCSSPFLLSLSSVQFTVSSWAGECCQSAFKNREGTNCSIPLSVGVSSNRLLLADPAAPPPPSNTHISSPPGTSLYWDIRLVSQLSAEIQELAFRSIQLALVALLELKPTRPHKTGGSLEPFPPIKRSWSWAEQSSAASVPALLLFLIGGVLLGNSHFCAFYHVCSKIPHWDGWR